MPRSPGQDVGGQAGQGVMVSGDLGCLSRLFDSVQLLPQPPHNAACFGSTSLRPAPMLRCHRIERSGLGGNVDVDDAARSAHMSVQAIEHLDNHGRAA